MSGVLVTGGAGFVGAHVVDALVARGDAVRVLDDLSTGRACDVHPAAELVVGDVADPAAVRAALRGVTRVVHLAAWRAVPRSFVDPAGTDRVNRAGTATLLAAASEDGVGRVVFASSSSVYGDARVVPTPESAPLRPLSPYAGSKADGERLCREAAVDAVCLRYFNVYGPRQPADTPYATLVPLVVDALRRGEPLTVCGDGRQRRDFTYVGDALRATLAALDAPGRLGGLAVNVAGGRSWSVLDVVSLLATELGATPRLRFGPPRAGDPRRTGADLALARDLLGYRPQVSLPAGLAAVVASAYQPAVA